MTLTTYRVDITGHSNFSNYTVYHLSVSNSLGDSWTVDKRYRCVFFLSVVFLISVSFVIFTRPCGASTMIACPRYRGRSCMAPWTLISLVSGWWVCSSTWTQSCE
jgi:hypothetical protein